MSEKTFVDGEKIHFYGIGNFALCGSYWWINISNQAQDVTCQDCLKIINDAEHRIFDTSKFLKELLATIHRDGGHYAQEHGLDKATKDAIDLILNERKEADEIKWMYESSSK